MPQLERIEGFPAETADALADVYRRMPEEDQTLFNDPYFLRRSAEGCGHSARPFVLVYRHDGEIAGGAAFKHEPVRLAGARPECIVPVTYRLSDFTAFIARPDAKAAFMSDLLGHLGGLRRHVLLPNLRETDASLLPAGGLRLTAYGQVANPICLDEDGRFRSLVDKKRNRYYTNRLARMGALTVTHKTGDVPREEFQRFVSLHRERWAYEGIESKFACPDMVELYRGLCCRPARAAVDGNGVVFSEVRLDETTVAMSVSYRWGKRLLYHVPTMNLEFLDYSPGQVLLREMLIYAMEQEVTCLDLGYGEESYKERFFSDTLTYQTFVLAPSILSAVSLRMRKAAARTARGLKTEDQGVSADDGDILLFVTSDAPPETSEPLVLLDFAQYVRYTRDHEDPPIALRRDIYPQFRGGGRLATLMSGGRITCCAWLLDGASAADNAEDDADAIVHLHSPCGEDLSQLVLAVQKAYPGRGVVAFARAADAAGAEAFRAAGMTESASVSGPTAEPFHCALATGTMEEP